MNNELMNIICPPLPENIDYDLYCPFHMEQHKARYINYLEVIIFEDGHIEYAIPSHQEKLIAIAMQKHNKSREELYFMCPEDKYFDFMTWLCDITGCISVWNTQYNGNPNAIQIEILKILQSNCLYTGIVPNL